MFSVKVQAQRVDWTVVSVADPRGLQCCIHCDICLFVLCKGRHEIVPAVEMPYSEKSPAPIVIHHVHTTTLCTWRIQFAGAGSLKQDTWGLFQSKHSAWGTILLSSWVDTLYTFGDNIAHCKTESVHFLRLMNSATIHCKSIPSLLSPKAET